MRIFFLSFSLGVERCYFFPITERCLILCRFCFCVVPWFLCLWSFHHCLERRKCRKDVAVVTEEVYLALVASGDWVGFFTVVLEYQNNVFVFKEARPWPGCLDSVDSIEGGLKEGWVCDVCFTALTYELPLFSKSIETEDAISSGRGALQQLTLGRRRLKWFGYITLKWLDTCTSV